MNGYPKSTKIPTFKRYCKVLKLQDNQSLIEKYKEVHKPGNTWPEITKGIRDVGIIDMEIYIHGNSVFMIMDTVPDFDHNKAMKKLAGLPRQKEWEEYVSQFQQAGDKANTPEKWKITERIFVLGRARKSSRKFSG
jgi:L-rhamnose mutarotase